MSRVASRKWRQYLPKDEPIYILRSCWLAECAWSTPSNQTQAPKPAPSPANRQHLSGQRHTQLTARAVDKKWNYARAGEGWVTKRGLSTCCLSTWWLKVAQRARVRMSYGVWLLACPPTKQMQLLSLVGRCKRLAALTCAKQRLSQCSASVQESLSFTSRTHITWPRDRKVTVAGTEDMVKSRIWNPGNSPRMCRDAGVETSQPPDRPKTKRRTMAMATETETETYTNAWIWSRSLIMRKTRRQRAGSGQARQKQKYKRAFLRPRASRFIWQFRIEKFLLFLWISWKVKEVPASNSFSSFFFDSLELIICFLRVESRICMSMHI